MRRNSLTFLISLSLIGLAVSPVLAERLSGQSTTILQGFEQTIEQED